MKIRKLLALLALAGLLLAPSRAASFEKGIRAGVDLASLGGDFGEMVGLDPKAGFTGGGFVAFPLHPVVALQVEALYTMKGAKATAMHTDDAGNLSDPFTTYFDYHYLDVPILLRLSPWPGWRIRPMVFVGPDFGVSLGGRIHGGGFAQTLHDFKAVDAGWSGGVGLRWPMAGVTALGDLRYTRGFADLWDIRGNLESVNSVFSLTVGVEW